MQYAMNEYFFILLGCHNDDVANDQHQRRHPQLMTDINDAVFELMTQKGETASSRAS